MGIWIGRGLRTQDNRILHVFPHAGTLDITAVPGIHTVQNLLISIKLLYMRKTGVKREGKHN